MFNSHRLASDKKKFALIYEIQETERLDLQEALLQLDKLYDDTGDPFKKILIIKAAINYILSLVVDYSNPNDKSDSYLIKNDVVGRLLYWEEKEREFYKKFPIAKKSILELKA